MKAIDTPSRAERKSQRNEASRQSAGPTQAPIAEAETDAVDGLRDRIEGRRKARVSAS